MYTLKSIAQRGTMLGVAASLLVAAIIPAAPVFADALNPLTERSLLLSSSAPGFQDTDGSNYSFGAQNPAIDVPNGIPGTYAPAGSGPNGKKTGQTFTFKVSSGSPPPVRGISFQYCTQAAGWCQAPGNNDEANPTYTTGLATTAGDFRNGGNYVVGTNATGRHTNALAHPLGKSDFDVVGDFTNAGGVGSVAVYVNRSTTPAPVTGWTFAKSNLENGQHTGTLTGKNNYMTLANTTGMTLAAGDEVQVVFTPSETTYLTNPGANEFFVKINTYSTATPAAMIGNHNDITPLNNTDNPEVDTDPDPEETNMEPSHTVIDGGVTVANVMTDSIHITTKVLETMSFSVGTQNRDTVNIGSGQIHGKCDAILTPNGNRLPLGNPDAEYSLETGTAYDQHSYWRLSSNSSGGATVYYSGNTLANTVGDEIREMANEVASTPGTEQFGLGFVDAGADVKDGGAATWAAGTAVNHVINSYPFRTLTGQAATGDGTTRDFTELATQAASDGYDEAAGTITGAQSAPGTAKFKFLKASSTVPERIAQQNETVISCATAKMRYVANIGADTPAGVYTTKINYLAAPQY